VEYSSITWTTLNRKKFTTCFFFWWITLKKPIILACCCLFFSLYHIVCSICFPSLRRLEQNLCIRSINKGIWRQVSIYCIGAIYIKHGSFKKYKFFHYTVTIFPHFGSIALSRVEGDPHIIKSHLQENPCLLVLFIYFNNARKPDSWNECYHWAVKDNKATLNIKMVRVTSFSTQNTAFIHIYIYTYVCICIYAEYTN
jgi:hypothetical protein